MYASLIGAGASQLYDLLRSQTQPSNSSSSASATSGTGASGSSFGTDLNKLLLDIQSGANAATSTSANPATTVADDLQSVFGDLQKASAGHGHHHRATDAASDPTSAQDASGGQAATASRSNPFQGIASSLLAYASTQGLTAIQPSSTSLTA